jgi:CRP-like cAMP-binding protein
MFGEQSLMPQGIGKSNAFVRTIERSRLLRIAKRHFQTLFARNKKIDDRLKAIQQQYSLHS